MIETKSLGFSLVVDFKKWQIPTVKSTGAIPGSNDQILLFLAGEVRWNRPTGEVDTKGREEWLIGVQLKSGAATDIMDWRDFHANAYAR